MTTVTKKDFCKIYSETTKCLHYKANYQIEKPVLLVCGAKEHTKRLKKAASRWATGKPNFKYYTIPLAGHCANMDNPGFFNNLLLIFLGEGI
jgi:pimeloyl-ACP methyl ester carboxylesterase